MPENKFKGQFIKNLTPLCNKVRVLCCFEWAKECNDLQPLEHPTIKKYELDYDYCCFSYAEPDSGQELCNKVLKFNSSYL